MCQSRSCGAVYRCGPDRSRNVKFRPWCCRTPGGSATCQLMHMTRQRALPQRAPLRQRVRWLRVAWAALFAVSTLLQLPAMAFAATSSGSAQRDMTSAAQHNQADQAHQHHQHDHDHPDGSAADPAHEPSCFALGCCFALGAAGMGAPTAAYILLGVLARAPARTMLPSLPDPAVPPPRLQV